MKIVYIYHKDGFHTLNGRAFWGIAEYDDYLLVAYKVANNMAEILGCSLTDLKYKICEKYSMLGFIYSANAYTDPKTRIDAFIDDFLADQPVDIFKPTEWLEFENIDVDHYEKSICNPSSITEDAF